VVNPDCLDSPHGGHYDPSRNIIIIQGGRIVASIAFLPHLNHVIHPQIPDILGEELMGVTDSCDLEGWNDILPLDLPCTVPLHHPRDR
jgi:hypothetical protein